MKIVFNVVFLLKTAQLHYYIRISASIQDNSILTVRSGIYPFFFSIHFSSTSAWTGNAFGCDGREKNIVTITSSWSSRSSAVFILRHERKKTSDDRIMWTEVVREMCRKQCFVVGKICTVWDKFSLIFSSLVGLLQVYEHYVRETMRK